MFGLVCRRVSQSFESHKEQCVFCRRLCQYTKVMSTPKDKVRAKPKVMQQLMKRARAFQKLGDVTTYKVPDTVMACSSLGAESFFTEIFPTAVEVAGQMASLARGPEGPDVAIASFEGGDTAVNGTLGVTETAFVREGNVRRWVDSLVSPPSTETVTASPDAVDSTELLTTDGLPTDPTSVESNLTQTSTDGDWTGVVRNGAILLYCSTEPNTIYAFVSSADEAAIVDPAAEFEMHKDAYIESTKAAVRFDGAPLHSRTDIESSTPRPGGWRKDRTDIDFRRDEASLLRFPVPTTRSDGMPSEPLLLAAARVRETSLSPPLVAGDTGASDAPALHERLLLMFNSPVCIELGGEKPAVDPTASPTTSPATSPKQPSRIIKLIPVQRGSYNLSGVIGGERVLQLISCCSLSGLASGIQDAMRMHALSQMIEKLRESESIPDTDLSAEQRDKLQQGMKNVDFFYLAGFRVQSTAAWGLSSNTLTVDMIRASALVNMRCCTPRGAMALLNAEYSAETASFVIVNSKTIGANSVTTGPTDASAGHDHCKSLSMWKGANVSCLDCITALPPGDALPVSKDSQIFEGVPVELRTAELVHSCVQAYRARVDQTPVTSLMSERSQLDSVIHKHVSDVVSLAMGDVHASLWADTSDHKTSRLERSMFMLLSLERAMALEVYRQETGELIPSNDMRTYIQSALHRLENGPKFAGSESAGKSDTLDNNQNHNQNEIEQDKKECEGDQKTKSESTILVPFVGPRAGMVYKTIDGKTDYYIDADTADTSDAVDEDTAVVEESQSPVSPTAEAVAVGLTV